MFTRQICRWIAKRRRNLIRCQDSKNSTPFRPMGTLSSFEALQLTPLLWGLQETDEKCPVAQVNEVVAPVFVQKKQPHSHLKMFFAFLEHPSFFVLIRYSPARSFSANFFRTGTYLNQWKTCKPFVTKCKGYLRYQNRSFFWVE
ncbi:hypothetical protein AVEN_202348-1 [Araneus ventricosus]|uniref:Uncharacterized protein n=1 Tax=Araneus ventricosus TaxID=182803 RepID=A0A4Y2E5F5_ARAVE|nr:hypothetical protein AVEN_202348-1 [Araneus ventricosus]